MSGERRSYDLTGKDRDVADLMAFLRDPASYAESAGEVEIVETHAAFVALTGSKAFKVKKHVKLPFLDFTTLERRRAALERELELNRDHAPELYLGLTTIGRQPDGTLAFGKGDPIEVALIMNRFDQDQLLARIAERGPLSRGTCRALADMVARYHREVPIAPNVSGAGIMHDTVTALTASLIEAAPEPSLSLAEEVAQRIRDLLEKLSARLDERGNAGLVRRCHGDLHLGNIVVIDGRVIPFDALEFDERLATVDVLYDLAFLLMDLDVRGDHMAANVVLNAYVAAKPAGSEIEGLAALPLFLATRAAVRALVAFESARPKPDGRDTEQTARAKSYLSSANRYLTPPAPVLIAVGGLSGTGKSTLAARLAPLIGPSPGALVLRTDVERKQMFDTPETERLSTEHYTEQVSDRVYALLYDKAERALAADHGVIFDAVSAKPEERKRIAAIAQRKDVQFFGLWLEAPLDTQIARVEGRRGDASDSDANVLRAQASYDLGTMTWTPIDAGRTPEHTFEQAKVALGAEVLRQF